MCQVPPIDSQWAPSSSRGRITSISASPIPIEPAVRTLFAKGLKIRIVPIAISMCQVPPIDSQEAPSSSRGGNTSISASPIPIGPAVRTLFVKRLKIRIVPIAIGMCQVQPTDSQEAPSSSRGRPTDKCLSHSDRTSRSAVICEKTENKECANRHVLSATDRFSIGTVIFPWSKHIEKCLFYSDRTSGSDAILEKAKSFGTI